MTLQAVPAGHLAAVVTTLEMTARPRPAPLPASRLGLRRWASPSVEAYRTLFRRVGARWLWFSRLAMSDEALAMILIDGAIETVAVVDRGIEVGLLELDFQQPATCEISYLGLVPELTGQGHGRWLMAHALSLAWRRGVERVWVRTCTLDHPAALSFYMKHGFVVTGRAVETFADPRLTGHLPRDAAPQTALLS